MYDIPATILEQASKCRHDFSCVHTGLCGGGPMCEVESTHGNDVLCVLASGWPECDYHLDFGGARFCVCPVRCVIHSRRPC